MTKTSKICYPKCNNNQNFFAFVKILMDIRSISAVSAIINSPRSARGRGTSKSSSASMMFFKKHQG